MFVSVCVCLSVCLHLRVSTCDVTQSVLLLIRLHCIAFTVKEFKTDVHRSPFFNLYKMGFSDLQPVQNRFFPENLCFQLSLGTSNLAASDPKS